jgi:hypothetical protein
MSGTSHYYVKALYYAWGRQDAGADVLATDFAGIYEDNAKCGNTIDLKSAFEMYMRGERVFKRT